MRFRVRRSKGRGTCFDRRTSASGEVRNKMARIASRERGEREWTNTSSRMRMSCGIENASRVSSYVKR